MDRLNDKLLEYKWPLLLCLVGLVLIIGGVFSTNLTKKVEKFPKESLVESSRISEIKVDVSGGVVSPGVYTLPAGSRVEDAIKKAGGVSEGANVNYLSKSIDLAQKINDGQKIYVPLQGESTGESVVGGQVVGASTTKVSLNSATIAELDKLPGVGPVTAQKMVDGRPYQSIDDLTLKKVLSKSTFDKIKDQIDL